MLNGFLSKEMFFAEAVHQVWLGAASIALPLLALAAGVGSVAYSLRFVHDVFFNGEPVGLPRTPHEPPLMMRLPVATLVVVCVVVGVFPEHVGGPVPGSRPPARFRAACPSSASACGTDSTCRC